MEPHHALNLRDSGASVVVGLRPGGGSWSRAVAAGLDVRPVSDAVKAAEVAMLLRHGLELDEAANLVDRAIRSVLDGGARTRDLARAGEVAVGTREFGDQVLQRLATPAAIGR